MSDPKNPNFGGFCLYQILKILFRIDLIQGHFWEYCPDLGSIIYRAKIVVFFGCKGASTIKQQAIQYMQR